MGIKAFGRPPAKACCFPKGQEVASSKRPAMIFKEIDGLGFATGRWPLDPEHPTLVFIHGSGGDHSLWEGQIDALAASANTLALDLPGHGASRGPGRTSVPEYAAVVAGLLNNIQPPRPIPCGLSLGGAIVLQLLLDWPSLPAAGVLMGTGARLRVRPAILETIDTDYAGFVDMLVRFSASEKTDPQLLAPVQQSTAACSPDVTAGDFKACDGFDVMGRLTEIDKPVLVMSGADDRLTPLKYSRYLEDHIRGSRRVQLQNAGHLVPIEQPSAVNEALQVFVAGMSKTHKHPPRIG
jgi:pimeloyl-ACP methyl ester carboxylesterase